jgi:hypothetical protein
MAKTNTKKEIEKKHTHGGAVASNINYEQELRRSVMANLLWEDNFYEDGVSITERIASLIPKVAADKVAHIAVTARTLHHLRHVPLFIVREMAKHDSHKHLVASTLEQVIQRADELSEFLALYWKDGKTPISNQVKKGLAAAFTKFNQYSLSKYNRDSEIKLRDVLFLCHAKPKNTAQAELWKKLIEDKLETPDTWEVELSKSTDKKASWSRLVSEGKLGGLATLKNIRNILEHTDIKTAKEAIAKADYSRVLPFRFISAAKFGTSIEKEIETVMLSNFSKQNKLPGRTVLVVDVSGSMGASLSSKSDMTRLESAYALAMIAREVCEDVAVYATAGSDGRREHKTELAPNRNGFALRDSLDGLYRKLGMGGIFLKQCLDYVYDKEKDNNVERVIVFTDEQDCDNKANPSTANAFGKKNYIINISSNKNGIAYDKFMHINGFSEAVIQYIYELENIG